MGIDTAKWAKIIYDGTPNDIQRVFELANFVRAVIADESAKASPAASDAMHNNIHGNIIHGCRVELERDEPPQRVEGMSNEELRKYLRLAHITYGTWDAVARVAEAEIARRVAEAKRDRDHAQLTDERLDEAIDAYHKTREPTQ